MATQESRVTRGEDNQAIQVSAKMVLDGFGGSVLDLVGAAFVGDLDGGATPAITKVGCRVVRLHNVEVFQSIGPGNVLAIIQRITNFGPWSTGVCIEKLDRAF
jgi:hypothetical protein